MSALRRAGCGPVAPAPAPPDPGSSNHAHADHGSGRGGHGARHRARPDRRATPTAVAHSDGRRRLHAACWSEPGRGRDRLTPGSGSSHHRGPARTRGRGCGVTRRRRLRPAEGSGRSQPGTARRPPTRWRACRWGPTAAPCPDLHNRGVRRSPAPIRTIDSRAHSARDIEVPQPQAASPERPHAARVGLPEPAAGNDRPLDPQGGHPRG